MPEQASPQLGAVIPYFAYRDGAAALEWLAQAFGFQKTLEYAGPDGVVVHAEMKVGQSFIMLGTASPAQRAPEPREQPAGHGTYVVVEDVDGHFARARDAGATILLPPEDTEWGSRRYSALDLDGYEWSFGSYRPAMARRNF